MTDDAYAEEVLGELNNRWPGQMSLVRLELQRYVSFLDKIHSSTRDSHTAKDLEGFKAVISSDMVKASFDTSLSLGLIEENFPLLLDRQGLAKEGTVVTYNYTLGEEEFEAKELVVAKRNREGSTSIEKFSFYTVPVDENGEPFRDEDGNVAWVFNDPASKDGNSELYRAKKSALVSILDDIPSSIEGTKRSHLTVLTQIGSQYRLLIAKQPSLDV